MSVSYIEAQARFCDDVHILIATNYIDCLCHFNGRMRRNAIRKLSYFTDFAALDVESKDLLRFGVGIGLSASAYQNCVISIDKIIRAVLSYVSLCEGKLVSCCLKLVIRVGELE